MCLSAIYITSLEKCLFETFTHFKMGCLFFFVVELSQPPLVEGGLALPMAAATSFIWSVDLSFTVSRMVDYCHPNFRLLLDFLCFISCVQLVAKSVSSVSTRLVCSVPSGVSAITLAPGC